MKLEITAHPKQEDDEYVIQKTREYNASFVPNVFEALSVYYKSEEGEIVGGLTGKTYWGWLHVEYLWVDASQRGLGLGTELLRAAEREALKRGCTGATLDTFSFQALDFYRKSGYAIAGTLDEYAGEHQRYYLQKKLA